MCGIGAHDADLLDFEVAREPPSPSSYHGSSSRSSRRRWSRRGVEEASVEAEVAAQAAGLNPESTGLEALSDIPAVEWLQGFLGKYRTLGIPGRSGSSAGEGSSDTVRSRRAVRQLLFPEHAETSTRFLRRFIECLDEQQLQGKKERSGTHRAASLPPEDRGVSAPSGLQRRVTIRSRSAGGEEAPTEEVAAAVARARRRALEQKRIQAREEEAQAKAWRRERYGKRDDRLARFAEEEKKARLERRRDMELKDLEGGKLASVTRADHDRLGL
mmetsp:Transcript_22364/g.51873  ORF Transcript_22364/g.51873 Transcript_22364/m.51873 type:complete len:272 (+) Transcript_22364:33-848(+)